IAIADVHIGAAEAQVADDHVVGFQLHSVAGNAHAIAGGGGAADRDIRRADANALLEFDDPGDVEDDNARPAGFTGFAKRSGTRIVEVGDDEDLSTAPAARE